MCSVGALALSGCSQDKDQSAGQSTDDKGATKAVASPLEEYMGAFYDMSADNTAAIEKQNKLMEESIAECMVAEGFSYTPNTSAGAVVMGDTDDGPAWGTVDYAKRYGYGISTMMGDSDSSDEEAATDPNAEYYDSLSKSEREAYDKTLYGDMLVTVDTDSEEVESAEAYDWTKAGCTGKAQQEAYGGGIIGAMSDPEFQELFDEMNKIYSTVSASPEVKNLESQWASCMADEGYPDLTTRESATDALYDEYFNDLMAGTGGVVMSSGEGTKSFGSGSDDEGSSPKATPATQEELDAFEAKEIKQATADYTCADKTGYTEARQKIQNAEEQKFIDANKTQLDALIAKYGQAQS